MDAMFLELQIQICVGETTRTPMLEDHGVTGLGLELLTDLTSPRAVFERLTRPGSLLDGRDILPRLVVAGTVATMQRIENTKFRRARCIQDLEHIGNTIIRFGHSLQVRPEFATFGNEIVVRINDEKCSDFSDKLQIRHVRFSNAFTWIENQDLLNASIQGSGRVC
jgi:hypothetical protein